MAMQSADIIAIYAAIVGTGALFLEVRRWFESGPRLKLSIISNAKMLGSFWEGEDATYLAMTVINRGDRATTVTNACLHQIDGRLSYIRKRWSRAAVLADVEGMTLPHVLEPGRQWQGRSKYDDDMMTWAQSGRLYVAIYTSHRQSPLLRRISVTSQ